jgi:hypothetical protein
VLVARKDLSRTVIEGGRYYHNSWFRRASHGTERATTREWLDRVAIDVDEADALAPPPRPHVHKQFHDKLAPAHRWLCAQVGRPWDTVYAELCAQFDTRTVAGRHVVHDHMLAWVVRHDDPHRDLRSRYDLVIDAHGILRTPRRTWRDASSQRADAEAWAAGRRCALTYRGWWWFALTGRQTCMTTYGCSHPHHHAIDGHHFHVATYTSRGPMTRADQRYLDRLPDYLRTKLVVASPWPAR